MPIVCIAGMHRSGTSMVARLLNLCGLYLGEEAEILPAGPDNPEGRWENRNFVAINDGILSELGGGWDFPPMPQDGWETDPALIPWRAKAAALVRRFAENTFWGWKDPRNSLVIPFWRQLLPDMRVIVCVRSPLEVASSLYKRNYLSFPSSYHLWLRYNRSLLSALKPQDRLLTHYDNYFQDPGAELVRLLDWLSIKVPAQQLGEAVAAVSISRRNYRTSAMDQAQKPPPADIVHLYEELCTETGLAPERSADGVLIQGPNSDNANAKSNAGRETADYAASLPAQVRTIHGLSMRVAEKEQAVAALTALVAAKEQAVAELTARVTEKEHELASVYVSRAWRLARVLRRISLFIGPRYSVLADRILRRSYNLIAPVVRKLPNFDASRTQRLDLAYCMSFFNRSPAEKASLRSEIDIIVPVFNGFPILSRLFESILQNTDTPFRLIVVDDNSTDPAVRPFLEGLAQRNSNIRLLTNDENLGFVRAVNSAAKHVQNHFVILNTDVELPEGWLERLMNPILSDPRVASSTPFTNAGTICSFPKPNADNPLFAGLDLNTIDSAFRLVDRTRARIELPTGVGFCMGINLNAWKKIGPFNQDTFGKGYGEENDWCMRAISAGFKNVLAPDLFVYHKHGGTFPSEEKQELLTQNLAKLNELHPGYAFRVGEFISSDPPEPLRRFVALLLMTRASSEYPILIVDHDSGGGANSYRKQYVQERLSFGQTVFLLTHDPAWDAMKLKVMHGNDAVEFRASVVEDILALKDYVRFSKIIYNNLVGFDDILGKLRFLGVFKETFGAEIVVLVHDYLPVCPSYTLLDYKGSFCGIPDISYCKHCLPRNPYAAPASVNDINRWRREWAKLLENADMIICFSESSQKLLKRAYELGNKKLVVQAHKQSASFSRKPRVDFQAPLSVGIVGRVNYAKGSQIIFDMAKILAYENPDVRLKVLGILHGVPDTPNLTVTGAYELSSLPDLLEEHQINMCLFPSIWPETFSYVTSELMELEMPLCSFNLGAPAERIRSYSLGYIIDRVDARAAVATLLRAHESLKHQPPAR